MAKANTKKTVAKVSKKSSETPKAKAAKKPAVKKSAPKKTAARKPAAAKKKAAPRKTSRKSASVKKRTISGEEHYQMVQTAAYFRAQRDGFAGEAMSYWIEAEKEIDAMLKK